MRPTWRSSPFPALFVLTLLGGDLDACVGRVANASTTLGVVQLTDDEWNVYVDGYETLARAAGSFCGIGLGLPASSPVTSVLRIQLIDAANSASMLEWTWDPNAAVASGFAARQSASWYGYLGQTSAAVQAGRPTILAFHLKVANGTNFGSLRSALLASWIGADDAASDGTLLGATTASLFQPTAVRRSPLARNEKILHNPQHTSGATRASFGPDTFYYMQPKAFRYGQGPGTGWRFVLQDSNAATAEQVQLGYVRYAADGLSPDTSAAGLLTNVQYVLSGNGVGSQAFLYTLTVATDIPLPPTSGIKVTLPPSPGFEDMTRIQIQDAVTTWLPSPYRQQWTWVLTGTGPAPFRAPGSTYYVGGMYKSPTTRFYLSSTAYQPAAETLLGPETLHPHPLTDLIGVQVRDHEAKAGDMAIVSLSTAYLEPGAMSFIGMRLIELPFGTQFLTFDADGVATGLPFAVPFGYTAAAQALSVRSSPFELELSDAALLRAQ